MTRILYDLDVLRTFATGVALGSFARAADQLPLHLGGETLSSRSWNRRPARPCCASPGAAWR